MYVVNVLGRKNLNVIDQWVLPFESFGVDFVSNESYKVTVPDSNGIEVGDIIQIKMNKQDYFYVIDKKLGNDLMYKSILEIFNTSVRLVNQDIYLKNFIDDNFIYHKDNERNLGWLDTSEIFDYKIDSVPKDGGTVNNILNAKTVISDTIFARKANFKIVMYTTSTNIYIKLVIQPQTDIFYIKLNEYVLQNLVQPQINITNNTCDIYITGTRTTTVNNTDGTTSSGTDIVSEETSSYYLLKNNTITTNGLDARRVLPAKVTIVEQKYDVDTGETPDPKSIADGQLLDTSSYYWSFDLMNEREMYLFELNIGDLVEIGNNNGTYKSVVTGMVFNKESITYKFGFNRIDLIFRINNNNKK